MARCSSRTTAATLSGASFTQAAGKMTDCRERVRVVRVAAALECGMERRVPHALQDTLYGDLGKRRSTPPPKASPPKAPPPKAPPANFCAGFKEHEGEEQYRLIRTVGIS